MSLPQGDLVPGKQKVRLDVGKHALLTSLDQCVATIGNKILHFEHLTISMLLVSSVYFPFSSSLIFGKVIFCPISVCGNLDQI